MTEIQAIGPPIPESRPPRFTAFLFDGVAYLTLLFTILYAVGFLSDFVVSKAIDTGAESGIFEATIVNLALISLFAIQHIVIARRSFKHCWMQFIPRSAERSIHMFCASLALLLLFWQWRPMPAVIWHAHEPEMAMAIATLSFMGWVIVVTNTVLVNHFELFQLHQGTNNPVRGEMSAPAFRTSRFVHLVRHPIYPGFIIALWAAPTMSVGHLLLAAATTVCIFIGIMLEECNPAGRFSGGYRRRRQHGLLLSWRRWN